MLIIRTRPVAEIIHAVSAASIFAGCADACASAWLAHAVSSTPQPSAPQRAIIFLVMIPLPEIQILLKRVAIGLPGADAHSAIEVVNEDFSVADLAGLG